MSDKNEDKLIDDHNYDGIQEYDNPMPGWWIAIFWVTVIHSIGYCIYYMGGFGPSVQEEWQQSKVELQEARESEKEAVAEQAPAGEEKVSLKDSLIAMAKDAASIEAGKTIFATKCTPCHGQKAEGIIGPNLTDKVWLHGGDLESIYNVIKNGVLEKGMIAWESQLSDTEMQQVVSYIRSIQNTEVAGKAPEGVESAPTEL